MKNMKARAKLLCSFTITVVLTIFVGIMGIYGMMEMDQAANNMYAKQATPLGDLLTATDYFQRLRVQVRNAIIYTGNEERLETVEAEMNDRINRFEEAMKSYKPSLASEKGTQLYEAVYNAFYDVFKPGILLVLEDAKKGKPQAELLDEMAVTTEAANQIAIDLSNLGQARLGVMETADQANSKLGGRLFFLILTIILVATMTSVLLALYISGLISKPLGVLNSFMRQAGSTGNISIRPEDQESIRKYGMNRDEIGECITSTACFMEHVTKISKNLETVANGDLCVPIDLLSAEDVMGTSLKKMVDNLNAMFTEVNLATIQVATGSKQIAVGSQTLAQGSTEQASSVEQLSSSISTIAQKTRENAEMAEKAADMANTIKSNAENGSRQMDQMMEAVKEINQASQSINKVIKVIDDIAFQTNILALNAAVEAARAGQHGKGFAVVAEEVRSLAAKSAEAAKDTSGLITNSMEKAELGARIADETAASLVGIVSGINESNQIISEIAISSENQAEGISQINKGIDQVAQVVQQNSATAEESSAASEELSEQSSLLENLIAQFKLKGDGKRNAPLVSAPQDLPALQEMEDRKLIDYGKY